MRQLHELVEGYPPSIDVPTEPIAEQVRAGGRVLVVLDDDPTGTQSVAGLPVITGWAVEDLTWGLNQGKPAVYVMTNSRSLDPADAARVNREVVEAALAASELTSVPVGFVSRSDSTLRGHFPLEPDVISEVLRERRGESVDAYVVVPAFPDAGRLTVDGIHYAGSAETGFTPAAETEFAKDATFGYGSSDLREWVAEKTGGRIGADQVTVLTLDVLRSGPHGAAEVLRGACRGDSGPGVVVVDCVDENDLRLLALGLEAAEGEGRRFVYRVGPPFTRARIGQDTRPPLTAEEIAAVRAAQGRPSTAGDAVASDGDDALGGLVVVGSHVAQTTRQLDHLRAHRSPHEIEIDVASVLDEAARERHLAAVVADAVDALERGTVVVRTSRTLVRGADADASLAIARRVSAAVIAVVAGILAARPPRFVVAKGGITSSDVATHGLQIRHAEAVGSMLPGIISLWAPSDGPAAGIPYIVFPGNVGGDDSLTAVVDTLSR